MPRHRVATGSIKIGFFDTPAVPTKEGALAGFDREIALIVAQAMKGAGRSRDVLAEQLSLLLADVVSKPMLDAYASKARDTHNISAARLLALVAVTGRFDLLDSLARRIGAGVLVGEELTTARLGHLKAERTKLDREIRELDARVKPIKRGVVA